MTTLGLADVNVQGEFFEDKERNLWFCTNKAIQKYDRRIDEFRQFYFTKNGERLSGDYQLHYLDPETENLWVRLEDTFYVCPIGSDLKPIFKDTIPKNSRRYKCKVEQGQDSIDNYLFIPILNGLQVRAFRSNKEVVRYDFLKLNRPGYTAHSLYFENDKKLWVGADTGLMVLNLENGNLRIFNEFHGISISKIKGIEPFKKDVLIVATEEDGIYYFDKDAFEFTGQLFTNEEDRLAPFQQPIDEIYLSSDHTLWISTLGKGVYFANLEKNKFKAFLQNVQGEPTKFNNVKSIAEDDQGRIWCLAADGLSVLDENGDLLNHRGKFSGAGIKFTGNESSNIYYDDSKRIWVGTREELYVLVSGANQFQKIQHNFSKDASWFTFISNLRSDTSRLFVSTQFNGMLEITEEENEVFKLLPLPELKEDYTLIYDSKGLIYLGSNTSNIQICRLENGQLTKDTILPLPGQINGLLEDNKGNGLWIATANGLFNLKKRDFTYLLQRDSYLSIPTLNGILQDDAGNLWLSSNQGLIRYNPGTKAIRKYSLADGLQALEFNFWSVLKTGNGKFVFGGVNGINIFNPTEIEDIKIQAHPVITGIKINGALPSDQLKCDSTGATNISEIRKLIFKYDENSLSIQVAALEYSDPTSNQFKYRMKGKNESWIQNGTDNTINLSFLSPGSYNLEIDATNSDGAWSNNPHKLQIRIKPPWYLTTQAIIFYILAIIGLIYTYYRYRIAQIRKEEEFKRKEAEFRQKEAEYKQLVAETETAVSAPTNESTFYF